MVLLKGVVLKIELSTTDKTRTEGLSEGLSAAAGEELFATVMRWVLCFSESSPLNAGKGSKVVETKLEGDVGLGGVGTAGSVVVV